MIDQHVENGENLDERLAALVVPPEAREAPSPKREFKPWHKPRKQLVRRSWSDNAKTLIKSLHIPEGSERIFRYLTLPGEDMLDIRCLRGVMEGEGFRLHYLGFNDAANNSEEERNLTLSANELSAQSWIDASSRIVQNRLEELAAKNPALAFADARQHGPYHAINLDFCNSIATKASGQLSGLDALGKLVQFQTTNCSHDWLLFIATRVRRANVSDVYLRRFIDAIRSNANANDKFKDALEELFQRSGADTEYALSVPEEIDPKLFKDLFCVGISKWLLQLLASASPQWGLCMFRSYCYSVNANEPDMLSLVYRVERAARHAIDPGGMLDGQLPAMRPLDEPSLGQRIVDKTRQLYDLDASLRDDRKLFDEAAKETATLLHDANYDISGYEDWARSASDVRPPPDAP
jgi:hypothetical protein